MGILVDFLRVEPVYGNAPMLFPTPGVLLESYPATSICYTRNTVINI